MMGLDHAYVTSVGRLVGVVSHKEVRKAHIQVSANIVLFENSWKLFKYLNVLLWYFMSHAFIVLALLCVAVEGLRDFSEGIRSHNTPSNVQLQREQHQIQEDGNTRGHGAPQTSGQPKQPEPDELMAKEVHVGIST